MVALESGFPLLEPRPTTLDPATELFQCGRPVGAEETHQRLGALILALCGGLARQPTDRRSPFRGQKDLHGTRIRPVHS